MNAKREWFYQFVENPIDHVKIRVGVNSVPNKKNFDKTVLFIHGRSEWIEKYEFLDQDLGLSENSRLISWDHRGQGASGGARGLIDDYCLHVKDIKIILETLSLEPGSYDIVSHSMGGLVAIYSCLAGVLKPRKLVLCSPLLGFLPLGGIKLSTLKPLLNLITILGFGGVKSGAGNYDKDDYKHNKLTHSRERFLIACQPKYRTGSAKFAWVEKTLKAMDFVHNQSLLSNWSVPALIFVGTEEKVVSAGAIKDWQERASRLSKFKISLEEISGARHELLNEEDQYRHQVIAKIKKFLD